MKKAILLLICPLFLSCFSTRQLSQNRKLLALQIDSLQQMGAYWETIGPWNDDDFEQIDSMLMIFPDMLEKVLTNPALDQGSLDTLTFFNAQSRDGRITSFNWEEKMGGTYQPFYTLLRYVDTKDSVVVDFLDSEIYVDGIYDLQAKNGEILYLVIGSGKGCTTCIFSEANLYRIGREGLESIFSEYGDYRYTEGSGFDYNEEKQELDINYYDMECTDISYSFPDSCKVEAHYFFDGENFVIKE